MHYGNLLKRVNFNKTGTSQNFGSAKYNVSIVTNNFDDNSCVIFKGAEAAYVAFYKKWRILHIVGLSSLTNVQ